MAPVTVTRHACERYIERVSQAAKKMSDGAQLEYAANMLIYIYGMSKLAKRNSRGALYRCNRLNLDLLIKKNKIITLIVHRHS
ncbi:MAG: hypothetical protein KF721_09920 [Ignavibacteriaceae bacterium]|nr:hypothetical protein [Ignavibacteriaceae bacterium]